jgi:hypothetical protein
MSGRLPLWPTLRGTALTAVSAACVGLLCAGCVHGAKPVAAATTAVSRPATTVSAAPSDQPTNLVADAAVRHELLAAFIAFRSNAANTPGFAAIPPSAVRGIAPRTLYYAFDSATGTYWAAASFSATAVASQTYAFVGFQDGGSSAVFTRSSGQPWRVDSIGPCLKGLPAVVATAWGLTESPNPMCPNGVPAS